ncbi:hypothetical protein CSA56_06225 [candidate division KSB3 bacterium]|uniref:Glycosyltransferase RgtA/B/C/D-like domain-containing protein n=1 Tax=candidate division KSB3 bacterium TaxID=2044937 RepID=A0A2G6KHQ8_9BACT|nr:MAG: hypothetical protein CSA56_06225 [candidate division KSB3 bacterium]
MTIKDSSYYNTVRYLYYAVLSSIFALCTLGIFWVRLDPNAVSIDTETTGNGIYSLQYETRQEGHAGATIQAAINSYPKRGIVNWFGIPFSELQRFQLSFENPEKNTIIKKIQALHEFHRVGISIPLYSWEAPQIFEDFTPVRNASATVFDLVEGRSLHITSTGNRAAFIYQGSMDVLQREISQRTYLWKIFFLLIVVIILGGIFLWTSKNDAKIPKPSVAFIGLVLLLFAAFAMNGYLFIKNPNFGGDAGRYIFPAYNFMHGKGYTLDGIVQFYPPGYGFITYFVSLLIPDLQKAGMLVSSGAYILSIIVAYYIGRFLAGKMAAFLSALFVMTCPYILRYSYVTLTECLYLLLALLSLFVYLKTIHELPTYLRSSLLGLLLGLTYCVREESFLIFIGSLCVWGIFLFWQPKRKCSLAKRFQSLSYPLCTLLLGSLLIAIPVGHLYYHTGHWSISGRLYMNFVQRSMEHIPQGESDNTPGTKVNESKRSFESSLKIVSSFCSFLLQSSKNLKVSLHTAWGYTWKIILHALLPLICTLLGLVGYTGWKFCCRIPKRQKRYNVLQYVKTGIAFFVFVSPLFVLILWGYMGLRHVMQHVALSLPLFAVIITISLNSLPQKLRRIGFFGVCILSLSIVTGVIEHVPFVKERVFFPEYMLTKDSMQIFKESVKNDRMPDEYIAALKAVKWQKFTDKHLLFQSIEAELEREILPEYKRTILKTALVSPFSSYTFLPDIFKEEHTSITLKRAAQWLRDNAQKPLKDLTIMARKGNIILFYAEGRTHPPGGTMVSLVGHENEPVPKNQPLSFFAKFMRQEQIDYCVVNFLAFPYQTNLKRLWDNPTLANDVGLVLEYDNRDDEYGVQIYSLLANNSQ